jgi:hypothetical protein
LNSEMKQELEKEWRRNKVLELSSQGYSERDIGSQLQISHITVHRDLVYLKRQAQDNLQYHIHEAVPEYYQKCLWGMKRVLKQTLEIAETSSDPKIKLEAMRIANDCYRYIMDLTTNGAVVTDAIKYVTQKTEQVNTLQKLDEKIEALDGETTTNGVF